MSDDERIYQESKQEEESDPNVLGSEISEDEAEEMNRTEQSQIDRTRNFEVQKKPLNKLQAFAYTAMGTFGEILMPGKYTETGNVKYRKYTYEERMELSEKHGIPLKRVPKYSNEPLYSQNDIEKLKKDQEEKEKRMKESKSNRFEQLFGKDSNFALKAASTNLESRGFDLEVLKDAGILEAIPNIKGSASKEEKEIQSAKIARCNRVNLDLTSERDLLIKSGMSKEEAVKTAVDNMEKRMELGRSLGLQNTAQDLLNLRVAELNGYNTKEDIEKLLGKGVRRFDNIKELIAVEAYKKGENMISIGEYDAMPFDADPAPYVESRKGNTKGEQRHDTLDDRLNDAKEEFRQATKEALEQTEQNGQNLDDWMNDFDEM